MLQGHLQVPHASCVGLEDMPTPVAAPLVSDALPELSRPSRAPPQLLFVWCVHLERLPPSLACLRARRAPQASTVQVLVKHLARIAPQV